MKPNDLRTALQGSLPDPPEDFDARSEQKLVTLLTKEEHTAKKMPGLVIAVALILVISMATALAAFNEDINSLLYQVWPAAARALRPVNLSMETAGIRLDILSASVVDNHMYVTFALTDLEGNRINENTKCEGGLSGDVGHSSWERTELLSFDPAARRAVFVGCTSYIPQPYTVINLSSSDTLHLQINGISTPETTEISNLLPLIEGKDYVVEAVPCPVGQVMQTGYISDEDDGIPDKREYPPILNPENSLEIPLADGFTLSGIGWIDGIMHVQIHMPHCVKESSTDRSFSSMHLTSCDVCLLDDNNEWVPYGPGSLYPFGIHMTGWLDGDDQWIEFLFPWSREEMEKYHLHGTFENKAKNPELLDRDWYIEFPVSMIRPESQE